MRLGCTECGVEESGGNGCREPLGIILNIKPWALPLHSLEVLDCTSEWEGGSWERAQGLKQQLFTNQCRRGSLFNNYRTINSETRWDVSHACGVGGNLALHPNYETL
jgi:hypothetical protein